ncbi:hypothetical protein [Microcoleus sp. S13C4]|uniref:hypothetical protein n=1 Tax=Microcoleus sp. S13C4 TaxID=3055410 RepID=UPI002FD74BF4
MVQATIAGRGRSHLSVPLALKLRKPRLLDKQNRDLGASAVRSSSLASLTGASPF